jgi:hypothetical protein
MIEEIKLSASTSIYKSKLHVPNRDKLIRDIMFNKDFNSTTSYPTPVQPGIQSRIIITTPEIKELVDNILDILFKNFGLNQSTPYYTHHWAYISDNTNKYLGWHTHESNKDTVLKNKWTYTHYIQMPDKLSGDDGKLAFKLDDGSIHMILPEVDDLYIFPCTLPHTPISNQKSSIERIVFAGVFSELDLDRSVKKNKTVL